MSDMPINHTPLADWQALLVRCIAFPDPTLPIASEHWWSEVVGEPSETRIAEPRRGTTMEKGSLGSEQQLVLNLNPNRIEWAYLPIETPLLTNEITTLGDYSKAINDFSADIVMRWFALESCPRLVRLAFAATLIIPVKDSTEGYGRLGEILKFDFNWEGSSDFLFQINRPRISTTGVPNLWINRLCKWSNAVIQNMRLDITNAPSLVTMPGIPAVTLDLDINTAIDSEVELTRDNLPSVYDELVTLAMEIAVEGDII